MNSGTEDSFLAKVSRAFKPHNYAYIKKPVVQSHLKNVYATLLMMSLAACIGCQISIAYQIFINGFISAILMAGGMIYLYTMPNHAENISSRLAVACGLAFFNGFLLGPLVNLMVSIDPSILVNALTLTVVVFAGFSMAAVTSEPSKYMYLGGICYSALSYLLIGSLINIFVRSVALFDIMNWIGLAIFCGFVLFDTQLVIEKRLAGDTNFVNHAFELFIDLIQLFIKISMLLLRKEDNRRKRRDD